MSDQLIGLQKSGEVIKKPFDPLHPAYLTFPESTRWFCCQGCHGPNPLPETFETHPIQYLELHVVIGEVLITL
ncbi:MAG: hypothetical protein AAF600_06380 [Bacteroidota bacterium]